MKEEFKKVKIKKNLLEDFKSLSKPLKDRDLDINI